MPPVQVVVCWSPFAFVGSGKGDGDSWSPFVVVGTGKGDGDSVGVGDVGGMDGEGAMVGHVSAVQAVL